MNPTVNTAAPAFCVGAPPAPGLYWARFRSGSIRVRPQPAVWTGSVWKFPEVDVKIAADCTGWHRLPEEGGDADA